MFGTSTLSCLQSPLLACLPCSPSVLSRLYCQRSAVKINQKNFCQQHFQLTISTFISQDILHKSFVLKIFAQLKMKNATREKIGRVQKERERGEERAEEARSRQLSQAIKTFDA